MKKSNEEFTDAQELAFAWSSVGMPLDDIAEDHLKMKAHIDHLTGKIEKVREMIEEWGSIDGSHHKQWCLDQIIQIVVDDYKKWLAEYAEGEDGPHTYSWDIGIAP